MFPGNAPSWDGTAILDKQMAVERKGQEKRTEVKQRGETWRGGMWSEERRRMERRGNYEGENFKGTMGERGILKECEPTKVKRNKLSRINKRMFTSNHIKCNILFNAIYVLSDLKINLHTESESSLSSTLLGDGTIISYQHTYCMLIWDYVDIVCGHTSTLL